MADFEIHLDLHGHTRPIGLARSDRVRGTETILFEYDRAWLEDSDRFSLEPALALSRGAHRGRTERERFCRRFWPSAMFGTGLWRAPCLGTHATLTEMLADPLKLLRCCSAEMPFEIAAELRGADIADKTSHFGNRAVRSRQHQPCLVKTYSLQVLDRS